MKTIQVFFGKHLSQNKIKGIEEKTRRTCKRGKKTSTKVKDKIVMKMEPQLKEINTIR